MYFGTKSYLKSNRYHTAKHTLSSGDWLFYNDKYDPLNLLLMIFLIGFILSRYFQ